MNVLICEESVYHLMGDKVTLMDLVTVDGKTVKNKYGKLPSEQKQDETTYAGALEEFQQQIYRQSETIASMQDHIKRLETEKADAFNRGRKHMAQTVAEFVKSRVMS